jgi:hypothetical protein
MAAAGRPSQTKSTKSVPRPGVGALKGADDKTCHEVALALASLPADNVAVAPVARESSERVA